MTIEERVGPWLVSFAGVSLLVAGSRKQSWHGARMMLGGAGLIGCAAAGLCNPRHATCAGAISRSGAATASRPP